jgi:hypothetical protein
MAGDAAERDLSWLDGTARPVLAPDGTQMLFLERGEGGGGERSTYHRRMDGSTPKRLGEGTPYGVSPDWTTALVRIVPSGGEDELKLVPIGAGETTALPRGSIRDYAWASWHPDGKRIVVFGSDANGQTHFFIQDVAGGPPRPLAQGVDGGAFTPDGREIAVKLRDGMPWALLPIDGGETRPIPSLKPDDDPVVFGEDGKSLYVFLSAERWRLPARVVRLDMKTGRRDSWLELAPPDRAGVSVLTWLAVTPNGRFYAYGYFRNLSDLYVVEGLK